MIALSLNDANLQSSCKVSFMHLHRFYKIFFLLILILSSLSGVAQEQPVAITDTSSRLIRIVKAKSIRQKTIDSATTLLTLAGDAVVNQGNTTIYGDSIVVNQLTGIAEVFGNVHINDADSVHTYAQYLKYIGNERIAYLKRNVKLTDGKAVLNTNELEYNLQTGIAKYSKGGKVVNGSTVLTSEDAVYYSDTKDVFFKKNVHLTDPKSDIVADSLRYNTLFKEAYFIAPTRIKTQNGLINTSSGTYNIETGEALFLNRTSISDSTRFMSGDKIAFDEKSGTIEIEGRGKMVDSVNSVIVLGDNLLIDRNKNSFLATRKPVMILYKNNDSTYISADTLFSGLRKYDSSQNIMYNTADTLVRQDSATVTKALTDSVYTGDSTGVALKVKESVKQQSDNDTAAAKKGTQYIDISNSGSKDSIRYFIAFHHVRIFNDSLQAVSDSLHYSTEDSTFKLFKDPVFWNDRTQVSGDTMYLFTKNQKAERLYVFNNGLVINQTKEGLFNQMAGRTINGYFNDGSIENIRVKGTPAESVFYPQDDDSAYIGMNRSSGDVIDIHFVKKELNKIKFINDVNGTLYPLNQIPADAKFLKKFEWMDKRRPKNKLELFE